PLLAQRAVGSDSVAVKSQKSKVLYIKAFACLKWLLYFRRVVLDTITADVAPNHFDDFIY
ncbi:MAG: hypothetical protein ACREPR_12525, partial [Brasilonema sp.]